MNIKSVIILMVMRTTEARYCIREGWCVGSPSQNWYSKVWETIYGVGYFLFNASYQAAVTNTSIFVAILSTCVAVITTYLLIRRRPSRGEETAQTTSTSSSINNATNVYLGGPIGSINKIPHGYTNIQNRCLKQPAEFDGRGDVNMWFTKLENYMRSQAPPEQWIEVAISYTRDHCLREIPNMQQFEATLNGYQDFKQAVIRKYGSQAHEDAVTISDLANRRQNRGESIRDFGRALTKLAEKVLYNTPRDGVDEHLKNQFARGIYDNELRRKAMEKILKIKGQQFSMEQLIEYVVDKEAVRTQSNRFTSCSESSSNGEAYHRINKPSRDYANHNNQQYRPNAYNSVNSGPNIQEPQNNHSVVTNNKSMINTIQNESVYKKRQRVEKRLTNK